MLPTILMLAAAAAPGGWAQFTRAASLIDITDSVEISTSGPPGSKARAYRLQLTHRTPQTVETYVTDSLSCPVARHVVISMRDLEMPHPAPIIPEDDMRIWMADGTYYSLHAPSTFANGQLTIESNVGSPLARWVDGALKALEPCWSASKPTR